MQRFNCLALECPLFGPHLLEASAGTGKTFSIEHIFTRLLLESKNEPIQLEEILAVTYTRAATRELKERIRSTLIKALRYLEEEEISPPWEYLHPFISSFEAIQLLKNSVAIFDRCQIFTIHGFCYRMLQEFAFEANLGFSLKNPDQENSIEQESRRPVIHFLSEELSSELVCPEQLSLLFGKYESIEEIALKILRSSSTQGRPFSILSQQFSAFLKTWQGPLIEESRLQGDFEAVRDQYKAQVKGNFEAQVRLLAQSFTDSCAFSKLIREKGSLFRFLSPENRKIRSKPSSELSYPGFFDWACSLLGPLVEEASNPKKIMACLSQGWKEYERDVLTATGRVGPDEILRRMREAVESLSFSSQLKKRFKAVIVDEFQDTDLLQWEIFQKLFLAPQNSLQACYFVGDPKQSIYRFRSADVYTYMAAREFLGEQHLYRLDTNYRSSKELLGALNALFNRTWLALPKIKAALPYHCVQAGLANSSPMPDGKKALHWMIGAQGASFGNVFLPFSVGEIEALRSFFPLRSFAILVKDRYEAQKALDLLHLRGIAAVARSHEPIGKTPAFRAIREFLSAVQFPESEEREKIALSGPFSSLKASFADLKDILAEKGLVPLFNQLPYPEDPDIRQVLEELFQWERREGFSFEGLNRFLSRLEKLTSEEGARRRREGMEDAVQVITLHISKGLEFDVVFALGLASSHAEEEEDLEEAKAESLRRLYVAMTRAKKRLYVPLIQEDDDLSPMQLFSQQVEQQEGSFLLYLEQLSQKESISFDRLSTPFLLPPLQKLEKEAQISRSSVPSCPSYRPCLLQSFTSLVRPLEVERKQVNILEKATAPSLETLPRGAETGVIVHRIFELLFRSKRPLWKEESEVEKLVEQQTKSTLFEPWNRVLKEMVWKAVIQPLSDGVRTFSLRELDPSQVYSEMEFLFSHSPHFIKGFIDLVFCFQGTYYLLDWKTNSLHSATIQAAQEEMAAHDYSLQAALYGEALHRYLGNQADRMGGVFYFFVRSGICLHFHPDLKRIEKLYE